MLDIGYTIEKLFGVLPLFLGTFVFAIFLTPIVGRIAKKMHAVDIPNFGQRRIDLKQEHLGIPRFGGIAIALTFLLFLLYSQGFNTISVGISLGVLILIIIGILDDIYDLPAWTQLLGQILAIIIIIFAGIRIESIEILGIYLDFSMWSYDFSFLGQVVQVIFPADILTIIWFLVIINAMNWVAGIDALEETMSVVAGTTLMLLSIKFGNEMMLVFTTIFTGSILGFWIFNFPPAKIYGGTVGNLVLGYLLAIFSIQIDGKMTTSILLLAVPLVDFIWVLFGRLIKYREFNPLKLMSISGHHHLHHRIMNLGYSVKQVLFIEISIFTLFAAAAYYFAGFNIVAPTVLASSGILILLFSFLSLRKNKDNRELTILIEEENLKPEVKKSEVKQAPEKEYAY